MCGNSGIKVTVIRRISQESSAQVMKSPLQSRMSQSCFWMRQLSDLQQLVALSPAALSPAALSPAALSPAALSPAARVPAAPACKSGEAHLSAARTWKNLQPCQEGGA